MPLPTMPMSIVFSLICDATNAPMTPPAPPSKVTTATSASRPSVAASVDPGLNPNQPKNRITMPKSDERHRVARDHARLAVRPVLALPGAEQQQRRQGAGRPDEVHRGRAGEVLHAGRHQPGVTVLEPAAAEHPVRADRVDDRREHDRVDHVGAVLDPLERRAPDDRQGDRAERELEQELRLDQRVRHAHHWEGLVRRFQLNWRKNPLLPISCDEMPSTSLLPNAKAKPDGPVTDGRDREVGQDLGHARAGVLAAREPDLEHREARLHEQHEDSRDYHPHGVDRDGVAQGAVDGLLEVVGRGQGGSGQDQQRDQEDQRERSYPGQTGSHGDSSSGSGIADQATNGPPKGL